MVLSSSDPAADVSSIWYKSLKLCVVSVLKDMSVSYFATFNVLVRNKLYLWNHELRNYERPYIVITVWDNGLLIDWIKELVLDINLLNTVSQYVSFCKVLITYKKSQRCNWRTLKYQISDLNCLRCIYQVVFSVVFMYCDTNMALYWYWCVPRFFTMMIRPSNKFASLEIFEIDKNDFLMSNTYTSRDMVCFFSGMWDQILVTFL